MPGKSKEYWAIGTVVVSGIASIVQKFGDLIVDLETIYISINSTRGKCEFSVLN